MTGTLGGVCGRYALTASGSELAGLYGAEVLTDVSESFNVAPTQAVPIVLEHAPTDSPTDVQREIRSVRWGLVPSWSKEVKGRGLINARSESITTKPSFRHAAGHRRAIAPSNGYFEWEARPDGKQPFFLQAGDGNLLNMAALYEWWRDPNKAADDPQHWLCSFSVLTCTATDAAGEIHDRSPLVLPPGMIDDWLDPAVTDLDKVREMVAAVPPPMLEPYPVSKAVNNVRNNRPDLIAAISDPT